MSENLLELVKKGESEEVEFKIGISDRTALRDLTAICEKGILQKVGVTGRETKYILTRHKTDTKPTYSSTNTKHDKEEEG